MTHELCFTPKNITKSSSKFKLIHSDIIDKNNHNHIFTPTTLLHKKQAAFHLLPILNTPPRFPRVINPFDAALTDRLHLPLIQSPLFHKIGTTPQKTSLPFEWTIEDVSSLGPVNVIACETQFQLRTPDPDLEAKAQEAINSYFNENEIVPSPMDSHLRNNQINLITDILLTDDESIDGIVDNQPNSNELKKKKNIQKCDGIAQTVLTFPMNLPKHVENLLESYFTFTENQQQIKLIDQNLPTRNSTIIDHEARDASLRRKLFDTSFNDVNSINIDDEDDYYNHLEAFSPVLSPELIFDELDNKKNFNSSKINKNDNYLNKLSSIKRESFGSISPISKSNSPPKTKILNKLKRNLITNVPLSPITSSTVALSAIYRSTPERLIHSTSSYLMEISTSSDINFSKIGTTTPTLRKSNSSKWLNDDIDDDELSSFDDEMQISQQEYKNNQQHPTTPLRSSNRLINPQRKNLSRSFSLFFDYELQTELRKEKLQQEELTKNIQQFKTEGTNENDKIKCLGEILKSESEELEKENFLINMKENEFLKPIETFTLLHRTDSGFNEVIDYTDDNKIDIQQNQQYDTTDCDISMRSIKNHNLNNCNENLMCSTIPSKIYF